MSRWSGPPTVTVSIDTEEDGWGRYDREGYTVRNIARLRSVQEIFDLRGARPTYLVNLPPLKDPQAVNTLGELVSRESVEVGAQCHSWNTPPFSDQHEGDVNADARRSMMSSLPIELNRGKVRTLRQALVGELGVEPTSFRAGRWGFGPSVARAVADEGFLVDCSVTPFVDWSAIGGPDFTSVPHGPYRFDPDSPFEPDPQGRMVELPTTIGFLGGDAPRASLRRSRLERSLLGRLRMVGALDRLGVLAKRWLSPETSTTGELLRLTDAWVASGEQILAFTFHSSTVLPGATPFVRDDDDLSRFLNRIDRFLRYCVEQGFQFATLTEVGRRLLDSDALPPNP